MRAAPRMFLAAILVAMAATPAAARDWAAVSLRGTVLSLAGTEWSEVENGAVLGGYNALRTLQSGRLELASGSASIVVGPNTAFELFTNSQSATTLVRQYSGTLTVEAASSAGTVRLETETVHVVPIGGTVTIAIAGATTEVTVDEGGEAAVTDTATGRIVTVAAGATVSNGPRGLEIATSKRNDNGNAGQANDGSPGSGGNAGANGNGNGNGNAGGNGNGNNGNGNGGNGNGNGGNNGGNGNGGGNSNGNGNGGGNSNGNNGNGGGN